MAELRAQMERLLLDARAAPADVRSCNGRPSASVDRTTDCASVVKGPVACAGGEEDGALSRSDGDGRRDMDRMEAELEAELSRLQLQRASDDDDDDDSPRRLRRDDQLEVGCRAVNS